MVAGFLMMPSCEPSVAVVPVLVGPLQALMAILPAILVAIGTTIVAMFKPSALKRFALLLWSQKLIVAPIVLAVWGLVRVWPMVFPAVHAEVGEAERSQQTDWPLLRGGTDRRGHLPGGEDPGHGKVVWSFKKDGMKTFYCSPAVAGNRVYATSALKGFHKDRGAIYSLDADSGKQVWAFKARDYRATFSSPSVAGNYLVVGEGLHFTEDARVFCIDIQQSERAREAVKVWEHPTSSHVESSPCIAEGRVYIGAGNDGMYCLSLKPDENGDAEVVWHLEGEDYPDCETSPVYHDGKVYFGLGVGGHAICCVDAESSEELWRVRTPYPVFGSPSIAGGKLFVGMGYGDYVNTAEKAAGNLRLKLAGEGKSEQEIEEAVRPIRPVGEVWCIDLKTHEVDWRFAPRRMRTVLGAVAVDGDRVYFGSRDGHLYCVSTDGKLIDKYNARAPIITSPAVADEHVYVLTTTGRLYGLDKTRLSRVWEVALNSPSFSSPAVARGHVYVGTTNNGLLCVGLPGREREEPIWRGRLGGPGRSGWLDGSVLPQKGLYDWGFQGAGQNVGASDPPLSISAPAAYLDEGHWADDEFIRDGSFYVGMNREGACGLAKLHCGAELGEEPTLRWLAPSTNAVHMSASATREAVFFVDGQPKDADRALRCLDPQSGEVRWRSPVSDAASGHHVITYDKLLIVDADTELACLDITSPGGKRELWRANVGRCVGMPAIVGDVAVAAVMSPPALVTLDLETGVKLWEQPLQSPPRTGPVYAAGRLWVGQGDGVVGYSLGEGGGPTESYTVSGGKVTGPLVCDEERIAWVTAGGELVVLTRLVEDGGTSVGITRIPGVRRGLPPLLVDSALLYVGAEAIQRYDLGTGKSSQWRQVSPRFLGSVQSPMIMVNSHVFLATDKKGFVCLKPKKTR